MIERDRVRAAGGLCFAHPSSELSNGSCIYALDDRSAAAAAAAAAAEVAVRGGLKLYTQKVEIRASFW